MTEGSYFGGPQEERSRRLLREQSTLTKRSSEKTSLHDVDDHVLSKLTTNTCSHGCEKQIIQLSEEKEFLSRYVQRLLNQLRQLLAKHGELDQLKKVTDHDDNTLYDDQHLSAPWLTSKEYANPLFIAYDARITELENALDENKRAMERMITRGEALTQENATLHRELESTSERMLLYQEVKPSNNSEPTTIAGNDQDQYLSEVNERIDILMSENNMLLEQVALQDTEISDLRKEVEERDEQLLIMGKNFNQATIALQELRDSREMINKEKIHCEQQLQQFATNLARAESDKASLDDQLQRIRFDHQNLGAQVAEYEALVQTIKKNSDKKENTFFVRYQNVCCRLRELTNALETKEMKFTELEELNHCMRSELEATKQDCEGMLKVMESMEKQLNQYSAREDAVALLEIECKEKVEEVLLEKEQIAHREAHSRREVARLLERIRTDAASHMKEQDEAIAVLLRKHEVELTAREEEIGCLNTEVAQLKVKFTIVERNQKDSEKLLGDKTRSMAELSRNFEIKIRELASRVQKSEEERDVAQLKEAEYVGILRQKERDQVKNQSELCESLRECQDKLVALEKEVETRRIETREYKEEIGEKDRRIQKLNDQLSTIKSDISNKYIHEIEMYQHQHQELKDRLVDAELRLSRMHKETTSAISGCQTDRERAEERYTSELEAIKARVNKLSEERSKLEKSLRDSETSNASLFDRVQLLEKELLEARECIVQRDHSLEDTERKVSELGTQLALALSKQQQLLRQEREMRSSLERASLEKSRMEREVTNSRRKLEELRLSSSTHSQPHGKTFQFLSKSQVDE